MSEHVPRSDTDTDSDPVVLSRLNVDPENGITLVLARGALSPGYNSEVDTLRLIHYRARFAQEEVFPVFS